MNLNTVLLAASDQATGRVAIVKHCGCRLVAGPGLTIRPCREHQTDYRRDRTGVADDAGGDPDWSDARTMKGIDHAHD